MSWQDGCEKCSTHTPWRLNQIGHRWLCDDCWAEEQKKERIKKNRKAKLRKRGPFGKLITKPV